VREIFDELVRNLLRRRCVDCIKYAKAKRKSRFSEGRAEAGSEDVLGSSPSAPALHGAGNNQGTERGK
jgi:hypothetical protein